jgi:hypothetical protein
MGLRGAGVSSVSGGVGGGGGGGGGHGKRPIVGGGGGGNGKRSIVGGGGGGHGKRPIEAWYSDSDESSDEGAQLRRAMSVSLMEQEYPQQQQQLCEGGITNALLPCAAAAAFESAVRRD